MDRLTREPRAHRRMISFATRFALVLAFVLMGMSSFAGIASARIPGSQLWVKRYNGPANGPDSAAAVAASPDGSRVFVSGQSFGSTTGADYATVAYDASTGTKLWSKRYNDPGNGFEEVHALGVSPDGSQVFVTGISQGSTSVFDYATVAYDASTGGKLWSKRYNGPGNSADSSNGLGVSPDGSEVFVSGQSIGSTSGGDYATLAYDASTGAKLWAKRYNGPVNGNDSANSLGVSSDGSKVFVTGYSPSTTDYDYATVAYDASTGANLWAKRYNGPGSISDKAAALAVSPDSSTVFVTGFSYGSTTNFDYATVAYDASTGGKLWSKRYNGPGNSTDEAAALAVSPDSSTVFVTGFSWGSTTEDDYATVAYDASTGSSLWAKRYTRPGYSSDEAAALGVSPDGSNVFVTGLSSGSTTSYDYATLAYDASTGAKLWSKRYNGVANSDDQAKALDVSPDGSQVFVTGQSSGLTSHLDYATLAYGVA